MADRGEDLTLLRNLLEHERLLSLALVDGDLPYIGLLPYVLTPQFSALVHVSGLARHGRLMADGVAFSILVHAPDRPDSDPLQVPRVTLQGTVSVLARGSEAYARGRTIYQERFPTSAPTFGLGDFQLCELNFAKGRLVAGFARARGISGAMLRDLAF